MHKMKGTALLWSGAIGLGIWALTRPKISISKLYYCYKPGMDEWIELSPGASAPSGTWLYILAEGKNFSGKTVSIVLIDSVQKVIPLIKLVSGPGIFQGYIGSPALGTYKVIATVDSCSKEGIIQIV